MKKLVLLIAFLISGLISFAQIDTTGMSDYEKYYYIKSGDIDTSQVISDVKSSEYDDLYYRPSKNQSRNKSKPQETVINNYYIYDDYSYASAISRFHYSFGFSYFSPYWTIGFGYNPFYYDPFYYDPWYWSFSFNWHWGYPYYGWGYPYYGWGYPYYGWGYPYYDYPYYYHDYNDNYYHHNTQRRSTYSTLSNSSYRRTGASTAIQQQTNRTFTPEQASNSIQNRRTGTSINRMPEQSKNAAINSQDKPVYNNATRRSEYTPTYSSPRMNVRPDYNTSTRSRTMSEYSRPSSVQNRTNTQTRTYSTPSRPSYSTPSRSSSYSAPSRSSSYSTPSRSSSYSTPSRSSGSYSSPSTSKSSSSFNSGSSSGTRSSSSSSSNTHSSGRR